MKKLLLIDGNSLVHRAYWALPPLTTGSGVPTNAVFGFLNMLLKLLEEEKPDLVAVAFDAGRPQYRLELYPEYKGHRPKTPDDLRPQFPLVKEVLEALRIARCELEGYEGDDIIGTLVERARTEGGIRSLIVTGDKDSLQLIDEQTEVLLCRKGISDLERYNFENLTEKTGLQPAQILDLKGLMGDSSDNIPGVPGVGEKTALKLLQQYGSLENLYQNIGEIAGKLREKLLQGRELAFMSRDLARIRRDVPLAFSWEELRRRQPDYPRLQEMLTKLEFKTLLKRFGDTTSAEIEVRAEEPAVVPGSEADWQRLLAGAREAGYLVVGYNPYGSGDARFKIEEFWLAAEQGELAFPLTRERVQTLVGLGLPVITYDVKTLNWGLSNALGQVVWLNPAGDLLLARYLLDPGKKQEPPAGSLLKAWEQAREQLEARDLTHLLTEVEQPLAELLFRMERTGIRVDAGELEQMGQELQAAIQRLTGEIYQLAGEEFNLNSPKQLGEILFNKLGLPVLKKTKTGFSTSAEVLEELALHHPIVEKILEYRQLAKLQSTYIAGLQQLLGADGLIHTTFNQAVTATGRLSSTEPNLQNIPVRLELGRRIRKAFRPLEPGHKLLSADYSQIELRILAHFSGDPELVAAFRQGEDIHTKTASQVFGVPREAVTREMRRAAKAVNFGIVYGLSDFGLARDLKISRTEARAYIESYFRQYPGVKDYINQTIARAKEQGYVTTLLGRRRYLPDLFSSNRNVRAFGERTAVNTPIQGTAADIMKVAMLKADAALKRTGLKARMLLQVHDELIFDVPAEEVREVARVLREAMDTAVQLTVPLEVEVKAGDNWYDMSQLEV
ncbi:DNA polymerase I [Carboxydocella sp. ULO1]|uniref:DNA polymerase I n=1 Tax=Carboxydocella sp. ULO1 TaxID=1926599 RepID=UPI0009AE7FBD|nr:DNA polymerase I [Carboxydocella sp. ULO1]GAW28711.1 DNA polymerase I [Carboxydocella sp. ULO1]